MSKKGKYQLLLSIVWIFFAVFPKQADAANIFSDYEQVYDYIKESTDNREQTLHFTIKDYSPEKFYVGQIFYDIDKSYAKNRGYYMKGGLPKITGEKNVTFQYSFMEYPSYEGTASLKKEGAIIKSEKSWYQKILKMFNKEETELTFNGLYSYPLEKDGDLSIIHLVLNQHSEYNYNLIWTIATGTQGTSLSFESKMYSPENWFDQINKTEKKAKAILKKIIRDGMTEKEKVKAIHDYIIKNCEYDISAAKSNRFTLSYTAYGCLIDKKAVCQGYAAAFNLLMKKAGLKSIGVAGRAGGANHMWNLVKVRNKYYYIDTTWDDPVPDRGSKVSRDYFLLTKVKMQEDHSWTDDFYQPKYLSY